MTFLRIGSTIVNLDRVTCIRELSATDAGGQVTQPYYRIEFDNRGAIEVLGHASELRDWLTASDLIATLVP